MSHGPFTTSTAFLVLRTPDVLVMRYLPGTRVDAMGIAENIAAMAHFPAVPCLLVHIPEGTDFAMDMLDRDHTALLPQAARSEAVAMVVEDPVFRQASELYFAYHPPTYRYRVFEEEGAAMAWLNDQLDDIRAAGRRN